MNEKEKVVNFLIEKLKNIKYEDAIIFALKSSNGVEFISANIETHELVGMLEFIKFQIFDGKNSETLIDSIDEKNSETLINPIDEKDKN